MCEVQQQQIRDNAQVYVDRFGTLWVEMTNDDRFARDGHGVKLSWFSLRDSFGPLHRVGRWGEIK